MKTLLCAIVKNENRYLNEWINHYRLLGFDDILLYDNNDVDGEEIDVSEYDFINVINYRGKHISIPNNVSTSKLPVPFGTQEEAYNDCYFNHSEGYDWIAYFDIDEFLYIDNDLKINEFLLQEKFNDADAIQINWEIYGDNNLTTYENKPVIERFTTPSKLQTNFVKTIVRTKNPNFISLRGHNAEIKNGKFVCAKGEKTKSFVNQKENFDGAKIKHFYTKTIEEWIDRKYQSTEVAGIDYMNNIDRRINEFFAHNDITQEKIDIIKQKLNNDANWSVIEKRLNQLLSRQKQ